MMVDRPFLDHSAPELRPLRTGPVHGIPRELAAGTTLFDTRSVVEAVMASFRITEEELRGDSKRRHFTEARGTGYWLLLRHSRLSLCEIARVFGKQDHSTVFKGVARCEKRRASDSWFRDHTDKLERSLEEKAKGAAA